MQTNLIGRSKEELDTPCLLIDLDRFESNIRKISRYCRSYQVNWRPHSKVHKSPAIAKQLLAAGAMGVTCAKLSEAEVMAAHDIGDILIANQVVVPQKLTRLAKLQEQAQVLVAMDNPALVKLTGDAAVAEGTTIPVLLEVDIGMNRAGVPPGQPVLDLAQAVVSTPGLALKGLMGYEGHILEVKPPLEKVRRCQEALDNLLECKALLEENGIPVTIVSAGGTGSYMITAAYPGITEIQAGGGIFMDAMYREKCSVPDLEYALTILTTVTSQGAGHVVVDAGFKTLSAYHHPPRPLVRDDLELRYLSAEHGIFDVRPGHQGPQVGDRIELVAGYSDSTTVLHDRFIGLRAGRVEVVWELAARGKLD